MLVLIYLCCAVITDAHVVARVDDTLTGIPSIYHVDCKTIVDSLSTMYLFCTKHRKLLHAMVSQPHKDNATNPSNHTTFSNLSTPQREERLHNMIKENKRMKLVIERIKGKISALIESNGVRVGDDLHEELKDIVEKWTVQVNATYPEGSFQHLFWEQQQKTGSLKCYEKQDASIYLHREPSDIIHITLQLQLALVQI